MCPLPHPLQVERPGQSWSDDQHWVSQRQFEASPERGWAAEQAQRALPAQPAAHVDVEAALPALPASVERWGLELELQREEKRPEPEPVLVATALSSAHVEAQELLQPELAAAASSMAGDGAGAVHAVAAGGGPAVVEALAPKKEGPRNPFLKIAFGALVVLLFL